MNRLTRFMDQLPASDKAIAGFLITLTAIACLSGLAALARHFQVTVPAYGGSFTEGVVGSPRFVNPVLAVSDSDHDLVALTYAGLMGRSADGSLKPVLAESYSVSEDGTIYTFTLRGNATFSDGTSVSADDVVYTVQKAQDPALKSPVYGNWSNIRAEAIDARTVRFTLPKAYAPFLEDATIGIMPKHVWQGLSNEEFPFSPYNTMPIGAGPFTAESVSRDSHGIVTGYTLSAFKGYVLGRPYLSSVKLSFYQSASDLQKAYQDGAIDSAYGIASERAKVEPYARVLGVFFNSDKNAALEDRGVRRALSLAVDRGKLTKELLGGYATPLMGPLPEGSGVPPLPLPSEETRVADARSALEDAGYEFDDESKTWSKDGSELSMTLTTSNVPELKAVAGYIQKDWQALGIPTELELADSSTLTQSVIRPRAYSALLFGEVVGTTPDLYAFWSSAERANPGLNIAGYQNEDVDKLLETARTQTDQKALISTLSQIQEAIAADYPAAFLYTPDFVYDAPRKIEGIRLSGVTTPSDRFAGVSTWYRYTEHVWPAFVPTRTAGASE
jgi:peptide/nickel transport system substrate-binding protein